MATRPQKFRFALLQTLLRKGQTKGFTLTELLVSIIISGIIVTGLLTLVVDLLGNDQRDSSRNETQREMQMAMDYIVQDLREAIYVYDGTRLAATTNGSATINPLTQFIPDFSGQDGAKIVLAFWKPEPIPYQVGGTSLPYTNNYCTATFPNANDPKQQECLDLQVSRRTYTLVVYLQTTQTSSSPWQGQSRIIRYALRKYTNNGLTTLTRSTGYVDPITEVSGNFANWPYDTGNTNLQTSRPVASEWGSTVLVDFVAQPNDSLVPLPPIPAGNPANDDCPANVSTTTSGRDYVRSTPAGQNASYRTFFACVRNPLTAGNNQDIFLSLRGSIWGRPGYPNRSTRTVAGFLPVLQTQVLIRGVLSKSSS
ncbi:MAG: prepilin-type N-terminal cleavage/methylation domain-containing protein [Scytolyngbya sp. HA4215-MV1]|jgi:prepilin-type N-terminal cleavage/methylation domain-containing protein|nr:prepilin-type N-terminal cleavage/methylation domain-containing protein [Scytolyngbya sp. HA4215-MV1]